MCQQLVQKGEISSNRFVDKDTIITAPNQVIYEFSPHVCPTFLTNAFLWLETVGGKLTSRLDIHQKSFITIFQ